MEKLGRIWLSVVLVEARADPKLEHLLVVWQLACNALDSPETCFCDVARDEQNAWDAGMDRMLDYQIWTCLKPRFNRDR